MRIGNTDMHILTFVFIVLEAIMFGFQYLLYLINPEESSRKYYLILLIILMIRNVTMGLFPDSTITSIPYTLQYVLTYGAGFAMASYFPYYFYKSYNLVRLKWHSTRGIFIFLHFPFFFIFGTTLTLTHKIDLAIDLGLIIPSIYGLYLGYIIYVSIIEKFNRNFSNKDYVEVIGLYIAVIPYATMAFCAYFRIDQVPTAILSNGGFVIITILFIRKSVIDSRLNLQKLATFEQSTPTHPLIEVINDPGIEDFNLKYEMGMNQFNFTSREKEVLRLAKIGMTYEEIGLELNIAKSTVKKHIENSFKKANVTSRVELIHKIVNT